jgi:iron complex outermembrane receptor protein
MVFAEEHDAGKEMRGPRQVLPVAALVLAVLPAAAAAQDSFPTADATPSMTLPSVDVIGATPLLGSGVDRDKVPAQTHVLTDQDISRNGYPQALRALNEDVPGVTLDAAAGNPFQPNLLYHGFLASPLQGNPQASRST